MDFSLTSSSQSLQIPADFEGPIPILSAKKLLNLPKARTQLKKILNHPSVNQDYYSQHYLPLFESFAEYVQQISCIDIHQYIPLDTLLEYGLALALISLDYPQANALEHYAMVSASLFHDIGKTLSYYEILINSEKSNTKTTEAWQPLHGPMEGKEYYFKIIGNISFSQNSLENLTTLLARKIMPEDGYRWLTSDSALFSRWLEWLNLNSESGAYSHEFWPWVLEAYQKEEKKVLLKKEKQAQKEKEEKSRKKSQLKMWTEASEQARRSVQGSDLFLKWLKEEILKQRMSVNKAQSLLHVVKKNAELLLVVPGIYEPFLKKYPKYKQDLRGIEDFLIEQNIAKAARQGGNLHFFQQINNQKQQTLQGLILNLQHMILNDLNLTEVNPYIHLTAPLLSFFNQHDSKVQEPFFKNLDPEKNINPERSIDFSNH